MIWFLFQIFLTWAAITLWRSAIKLHLAHVHNLNLQCFLWPFSQEIIPWFLHRAHFGLRIFSICPQKMLSTNLNNMSPFYKCQSLTVHLQRNTFELDCSDFWWNLLLPYLSLKSSVMEFVCAFSSSGCISYEYPVLLVECFCVIYSLFHPYFAWNF